MQDNVTQLLIKFREGSKDAYDEIFPHVYERLKRLASRQLKGEAAGHTYSKTDLVHEAYLKLIDQAEVEWQDRAHFYALAARSMRRILIEHARKKKAAKRGGSKHDRTFIDEIMRVDEQAESLLEIDDAINKLADMDERMAKVVECRYFGEMTYDDIAEATGVSTRTAKRDWELARGWLYKELKK